MGNGGFRIKLTVRRLMVLVAIVAFGLVTFRRVAYLRERAEYHAWNESGSMAYTDDARGPAGDTQRVERGELLAAYHARMRQKYERAIFFPWLPIEPDPPEP
jgi:hypothetical protein